QPTCAVPSGKISITAPLGAGFEYSIDGTNYQESENFINLTSGTYSVTARNTSDSTCVSTALSVTINDVPNAPATPTADVVQPTCAVPSGKISITAPLGPGFEYSIDGTNYQASVDFINLTSGTYSVTARNTSDPTCVSTALSVTINDVPNAPATPTADV
uniref:hypothetical protein n=1 Tax=Aequorivita sinensis TaxID=1382458 RepID=UPI00130E0B8F